MEYISHSDYTKMLGNFGKETPKGILKEGIENEGNAFTAGLAKTKKGGEFKVDGKAVKDTSNYDAPVKEYSISDEYPESWKMREGEDMEEGLNLPSPGMKATGQTIVTTEADQLNRFSVLSPSEREQLKEYIESIKTIKQEIKKLVEKASAGMMEDKMGGNRTGLVMTKGTVSEKEENIPAEEKPVYHEPTDRYKSDDDRTVKVLTKAEMWEDEDKSTMSDEEAEELIAKFKKDMEGEEAVKGQWDI